MYDMFYITVETATLIRTLLLGFLGFLVSMLITPLYTTIAYKYKWWKKPRVPAPRAADAPDPTPAELEQARRLVPIMAGIVFVAATALVTVGFNFSREQTWLPLAAFVGAGVVGLLDDIIELRSKGARTLSMRRKVKFLLITLVGIIGGWYFYDKLDVTSIHMPFIAENLHLGWWIVPLFMFVVVATANAVNTSDGLDGLAGGLTATAFGAYAIIAALEGRFGVAGFCLTIVGALLSYTWFNVYPARFFMSDVGSFALGTALGAVAMITDTVLLLPVIGFVFVAEAGSRVLQGLSKKLRGRGLFKVAPVHLHFEAIGWPETKVTMRFWVFGQACAVLGIIVFLYGKYL